MSSHDCWHFLSAMDVIFTVTLATVLLMKQIQDLSMLWDQLEKLIVKTRQHEGLPKFCVYYVRIPLMLSTFAFMGRLAWTVGENELAQVSADVTTMFLLTALWMGIFTFTKPLQQFASMYVDVTETGKDSKRTTRRLLGALQWFSWTSLAVVWTTFFIVEPLKMIYNRRWFDTAALGVYSLAVVLWVVVALKGWFLYPKTLPLKNTVCKYLWLVCLVVGLLVPVVMWRMVHLVTHREQEFVIEEGNWTHGERFTRMIFASVQGAGLIMAYNFSSVTPKKTRNESTHDTNQNRVTNLLDENRSPVRRRPPGVRTCITGHKAWKQQRVAPARPFSAGPHVLMGAPSIVMPPCNNFDDEPQTPPTPITTLPTLPNNKTTLPV